MPHSLVNRILLYLSNKDQSDTLELSEYFQENHQNVVGAVKSLESFGYDVIRVGERSRPKVEITEEGKLVAERGSHEALVFGAVPSGDQGISAESLMESTGRNLGKIGMSKAIANGWLKIVKNCENKGDIKVVRLVDTVVDNVKLELKAILEGKVSELDGATLADLKKRKLITRSVVTYFAILKGAEFSLDIVKREAELTSDMLQNGSWKDKTFKPYNFKSLGSPLSSGHLHPLMKMRTEIRSVLLEMGFTEMAANRWVESSFWNFDALFVPQKHPARDVQDTFFMSQPERTQSIPEELKKHVKNAHEGEDYQTNGHGPCWREEETFKNCLRTHTTSTTARMLYAIGSSKKFTPIKMFSVDRVYRNETLDQTHLAEFYQVEGVIADYNLSLGNLIGVLREFFGRLGIRRLRFKPAYNPYTEPSMELFAYHDSLKRWVEIGNSGMFRPEVMGPMGLPKNVRAIAWGLSLERPTMIRYGIKNIRELVGHRVDLQMVYDNPLCWVDKCRC